VDLVVDEVEQLQDVHVADRDLCSKGCRSCRCELHLARGLAAGGADWSTFILIGESVVSAQRTSASSTSVSVAPSKTGVATGCGFGARSVHAG
jgi:hypothetical protein